MFSVVMWKLEAAVNVFLADCTVCCGRIDAAADNDDAAVADDAAADGSVCFLGNLLVTFLLSSLQRSNPAGSRPELFPR